MKAFSAVSSSTEYVELFFKLLFPYTPEILGVGSQYKLLRSCLRTWTSPTAVRPMYVFSALHSTHIC